MEIKGINRLHINFRKYTKKNLEENHKTHIRKEINK